MYSFLSDEQTSGEAAVSISRLIARWNGRIFENAAFTAQRGRASFAVANCRHMERRIVAITNIINRYDWRKNLTHVGKEIAAGVDTCYNFSSTRIRRRTRTRTIRARCRGFVTFSSPGFVFTRRRGDCRLTLLRLGSNGDDWWHCSSYQLIYVPRRKRKSERCLIKKKEASDFPQGTDNPGISLEMR